MRTSHSAAAFADHETVDHGRKEYVRLRSAQPTRNTIEGFFSIFKRGMRGTYQHCGEQHLQRYLADSISDIASAPSSA